MVHVIQIAEPYPTAVRQRYPDQLRTVEMWIDQMTGDVVVWQRDPGGTVRGLTVKHNLVVQEFRAEPPTSDGSSFTSLHVTRVLAPDDPNLPDPTHDLTGPRSLLARGAEEIERQSGQVDPHASFEGQPAIKLVMPFRDTGQIIGTLAVYFDPKTLFSLAQILYPLGKTEQEGEGMHYSYPTIETFERDAVLEGTFDPEIPDALYTYIRERFAPDGAARFSEYPIWWLGPTFGDYHLQWIERNQSITPEDNQITHNTVSAFYLKDPTNHEDSLHILSEPPLTDVEWAHRDANHNVHSFEAIEIQGHRAWTQPGQGFVEVDFGDSWVSISTPNDDLALAAAEALQRINADVVSPPSSSQVSRR